MVAIIINGIMAFVANNLLAWDFPSFLTEDFERVLPAVNLSLAVTVAVNVLRIIYDARWFARVTEVVSLSFNIAATLRLLDVFPFEFDAGQDGWETMARLLLIFVVVGSVVAIVTQFGKLIADAANPADR